MQIGVLGRLQVLRNGAEVDLGPNKQRALLAGLVLHANSVVSLDAIIDLVWGEQPPSAVAASVHGYVAGLRRALEPSRGSRGSGSVLVTTSSGYSLRVPDEAIDASRFARLTENAHRDLASADPMRVPADLTGTELAEMATALELALALWRGTPYAELDRDPAAAAERTRLENLRLDAIHDHARVQLALDRPSAVATQLVPLTQSHPLREDLWALLALALARTGRQADALQALRTARTVLDEELGIDPGPALRELKLAILRQDPSVLAAPTSFPVAAPPEPPVADVPRLTSPERIEVPLVGRQPEIQALERLLEPAAAGRPQWVLLVGEPGIGKTRLTAELAGLAADRGFAVRTGRCSSDEGAPPLWPWVGVLHALPHSSPTGQPPLADRLLLPTGGAETPVDRFRLFDEVTQLISRTADDPPLLLIFDDLHWADASTLRLLQHLVENTDRARLLVAATRRANPEPTGPLAELGAALARRGATRLALTGLTTDDVGVLADAMTSSALDRGAATALHARTGGNPFFVIELLRSLEVGSATEGSGAVPAAISDVIAARVGTLPPDTQRLLQGATALGRHIDVDLLGRLEGADPEAVLEGLEPAHVAGLLVVDAHDGALRFSHALVRDAIDAMTSPLRRQLRHAKLAGLLSDGDRSGPRLAEIATHWLRSGPMNAGRAWRAAAEAAAYATSVSAHEEAADLLAAAVVSQASDPAATVDDRYELLMAHARACRAAADSDGQRFATAEAIRLAEQAHDVERLAEAAVTSSEGALWSNRPEGEIDQPTLDALHRAAADLPGTDTVLRCRVFLALSREMFWAPGHLEAEAYAEQGLAMARRLGEPRLRAWACHTVIVSTVRPATLEQRTQLADESVECARVAGDVEALAVGRFWRAIAAGEAGRVQQRDEDARAALDLATRLRLRYLQVMVGGHQVPWLALHGRFDEADRLLTETERWAEQASFPFRDESVVAAHAFLEMWRGRAHELLADFAAVDAESPVDMGTALLLLLLRAGRLDDAAAQLDHRPVPLVDDDFAAPLDLAIGAEAALLLRRPGLASEVYARMAPWSGRAASAGTGGPVGPVDAYLALAAAAVGETGLATDHADAAMSLCRDWRMPPVAEWLAGYRTRFGF